MNVVELIDKYSSFVMIVIAVIVLLILVLTIFMIPKFNLPNPLFKRIAKYCLEQHKFCILVGKPNGRLELTETVSDFNPTYVTTVQFYSKLRETLYILMYLA